MRAADLLPVHRQISDSLTQAIVARELGAGESVSCHKGCSSCCKRLYVEVTDAEAYRLMDVIHGLPSDHRARIEARFESHHSRIIEAGLFDSMMTMQLYDDNRLALSTEFYELGIACPFLEDDACSIYQERPLACREYLVSSPVIECSRPQNGKICRVEFPNASVGYAMHMTQNLRDDAQLVPLALLPYWLSQHPEPPAYASGIELLAKSFTDVSYGLDTSITAPKITQQHQEHELADEQRFADSTIVPEYEVPDALMVPHYGMSPIELMENIATAASRSVGVILITPDPDYTRAFIERQQDPERFSILIAASNTAWIRDRAPIPVRNNGAGVQWYLPRLPDDDREADANLFETICTHPTRLSPFTMARGNLVSGPSGLALSSNQLFDENTGVGMQDMPGGARQLGIHRWIVFKPFTEELTHHADVHVRFLSSELAAVAWNLSVEKDRELAENLAMQLAESLPGLRILHIPIRSDGARYASLLNWIQLGKTVLMPRYELTESSDIDETRRLLEGEGYGVTFIDSPTLETGGSLHCLTASVYMG